MTAWLRVFCFAVASVIAGCAGSLAPRPASPPLALSLVSADGQPVELAALGGAPKLVFLFATYDQASQFALVPLAQFAEQESRVKVLGVALQPNAKTFLRMFANAMSVPFPLYYEPGNQVLRGETALGDLPGVPAIVALDAQGHIRATHLGVASAEQLRALAADAAR